MKRAFLGMLFLAVWPVIAAAQENQFVLLDTLYTHTLDSKGFSYFQLPKDVPDDWTKPLNFHRGSIHFRLEVLSKPSNVPVNYQLCVFQDRHTAAKHA